MRPNRSLLRAIEFIERLVLRLTLALLVLMGAYFFLTDMWHRHHGNGPTGTTRATNEYGASLPQR